MATTADRNKEPMKSGLKVYNSIYTNNWKSILRIPYYAVQQFVGNDAAKIETIISFILGQTDLVMAYEQAESLFTNFGKAYRDAKKGMNISSYQNSLEWDAGLWKQYEDKVNKNEDTTDILKQIISSYFGSSSKVPSRQQRSTPRIPSGTP